MNARDYLRVLREQWLVVLLAVLLGICGAAAAFFLRPPQYTAKLTIFVSAQGGDTTSAAYQGAQLSEARVTSYVQLVNGRRVTEEVIGQLQLPETPDELAKQITASSALDSVLIDVAVVDHDPQRAAAIANSIGQAVTNLVDELERPVAVNGTPEVAVRVVQPAAVPTLPSSTGLLVTMLLGLLGGLAVGVGAALARNALDVSVTSPEQLAELSGAPTLGNIAFDQQVAKRPLTVHEDSQSSRSEAFRQIRTNLRFVDVDHPRKVIVVTSSLPGEGKTTTSLNLAIALASAENRVLVIDADLRRPKVAALLGLEGGLGLTSVLSGRVGVAQAIQQWGGGFFDVLTSGPLPPNPSELLASQHMSSMLDELRKTYDVILIDSPPLLPVTDAAAVAPITDGALLICRYKKTTRAQATHATTALRAVGVPVLGTVFTMVPANGPRAYAQYNSYYRTELPQPTVAEAAAERAEQAEPRPGRERPTSVVPPAPPTTPIPVLRRSRHIVDPTDLAERAVHSGRRSVPRR